MIRAFFLCALVVSILQSNAQLEIINTNFTEFNVTRNSLSQITINNTSENGMVRIEGTLSNSANEVLLKTLSEPIELKSGVNILGVHNYSFAQFSFSGSPQAKYIQNLKRLPSGAFNYCLNIIPITGLEVSDEFCQSIDASLDEQMFLVNPFDGEELNSSTPILSWSHTEPFNLLAPGEHFRIKVAEIKENQSAAEAVQVNTPVYINNYVEKHHVQYPLDASPLEKGKKYAWLVEKISNSNIISTTEVWEFKLPDYDTEKNIIYVDVKPTRDAAIYTVVDEKILFNYKDRYETAELHYKIKNSNNEVLVNNNSELLVLTHTNKGTKSYVLDVSSYNLPEGYYLLEVLSAKEKTHYLNCYVP